MTAPRDFVAAMVRCPLDRVLPLVYADFLDEAGEGERARWVRLGEQMMRAVETAGAIDTHLAGRRAGLWRRLRPAYWPADYGPPRHDPAPFHRLTISNWRRMGRLAAEDWPRRALADGWLGEFLHHDDTPGMPQALDYYGGSLAGVPLTLTLAPAARTPEFVADLFGRLARRPMLTRLTLNFRDPGAAPPAGRSWLQRVFADPPPFPHDADLLRLAPLANLCALTLTNCPGVTAAGVAALRAAVPGLEVHLNGAG